MTQQDYGLATAVDDTPAVDMITGVIRPQQSPAPRTDPFSVIGAAFQNENTFISYATQAEELLSNRMAPIEGYSSWSEVKGTDYEQYWNDFAGSQSPAETTMLKARIDRERENDRTIEAAGGWGFLASLAAGIIDPVTLVPVGGELSAIKTGAKAGAWAVGRSALRVGAAGAAGTALQEGILQGTQNTRTAQEGLINIGSGAVLSGLLGGAAAGVLNRVERAGAERAIANISNGAREPVSAGAAAVDRATLDDLSMSTSEGFGGAAEAIARSTQAVAPNLQAQFSPSAVVRRITQMLSENTLYQRMNDQGRTLGAAAETNARVSFEGRTATALRESEAIFREAKKAGVGMSRTQFEEAVGRAMRRGDKGENDFVGRAAQAWRKSVFDPYQNESLDLGLLGEGDVKTTTAESYLNRQYKRPMLIRREREFKDLVAGHYEGVLRAEFQASQEALTKRLAAAEQRLSDLRLSPDERLKTLDEIQSRGDALDAAQPDAVARVSAINDLRKQQKVAKAAGDRGLVKALEDKVAAEKLAGGEQLKGYLSDRRRLRQRRSDVDMNFAGLDARHNAIMQSLVDVEEANLRSLNRLVERGRKLERELQKLDPDEAARKVADLRTSFIQISEKADKALDRAAERLRKMDAQDAKAVANGEAPDAVAAKRNAAQRALVEKEMAAQRNRSERMSSIARRLETADEFDLDATTAEIRASVDGLVKEVSDLTLARGEKAQRLKTRLENLDPSVVKAKEKAIEARKVEAQKAFDERWRQSLDEDGVGFKGAARDIADDAHAKLTGTNYGEQSLDFADHRVAVSRGPLKDRTLNVPDILIEDFLESNIRDLGERYARTMAGEVELTRSFGRADMRDQITEITTEYARLRDAVPEGPKREATLKALDDRMRLDIRNVEALRDLMRGTYMASANNSVGGRFARGLTTFNYIRSMGSAAISNLSDLYRSAMVYGVGPFLNEGIVPMLTNLQAAKLSREDAKLMGLITEMHTQHRMMSMGEMGDPYRSGTGIERLLTTSARVASNWNGINLMTDLSQAIAATLSQNRILAAAVNGKDARLLAYLGIDEELAGRIAKEFKAHGGAENSVKVANTEKWADDVARRAYQAAVSKDVSSVVTVKSVGDVPLLANHPMGKALIQFRTFALASHSRVLLRGLQESKTRFVSGLVTLTAFGSFVSALTAWRGGDERWEKFKTQVSTNPGYLVGEGLDRSGIFALGVEIGNTTEVLTRPSGYAVNPIKSPFLLAGAAINPEASAQAGSDRTFDRGLFGAVAGPTVGLIDNIPSAIAVATSPLTGQEPSKSQVRKAQAYIPFGSYAGLKEMLQALSGDSPYAPDQ